LVSSHVSHHKNLIAVYVVEEALDRVAKQNHRPDHGGMDFAYGELVRPIRGRLAKSEYHAAGVEPVRVRLHELVPRSLKIALFVLTTAGPFAHKSQFCLQALD
jgi:hypothetical protein